MTRVLVAVSMVALLVSGTMLARRLLIAGTGGAIVVPVTIGELNELTTSPQGGWSEPQKPKAVNYGGHTYIGYIAGGSSGDVTVLEVNNSTLATTSHVLNASLHGEGSTADMHSNPALLVRDSDHRLIAAYTDHADSTIRIKVSTDSLDTDPTLSNGFGSEASLDAQLGTSSYDYPILCQQLGETGDPIYLFFRSSSGSTSRWLYSTNTDAAASGHSAATGWSANRWLYRNTGFTAYGQISGDGNDRIDFIFQDKNETETVNNGIYHGYLESGAFYKSDGTLIGAAPLETPLTPADLTLAADSAGYHLFGLERDTTSGDIAFTASARVSGVHHVYRVMWDGATWDTSDITTSEAPYSWGNVIDPDDFDHALVTRWSSGVADLWDFRLSGATWTGRRVSPGGADDWLWPNYIRDGDPNLRAIVLYGTYTTYTDSGFQLAIYGLAD